MLRAYAYYGEILAPPHSPMDFLFSVPFSIWSLFIEITPFVLYIGAAILLWKFALLIAKRIAPDEDDGKVTLALDSYAIHVITFAAIGIILVVKALPDFIQFLLDLLAYGRGAYFYNSTFPERPHFLISLVQISLGVGLIYGKERIVKSIHTVRDIKNLGRDPVFKE